MKVFLSNAPSFILARELRRNPIKSWIYFGTDDSALEKLQRVFDQKAEQLNYGEKLNAISNTKRNQFILWIDQIAACFSDRKEWLFSVPAVKNTYTSNLFLYTCYLFLLEDFIIKRTPIDFIFVDSPALAAIFRDNFRGSITIASVNRRLKFGFYFKVLIKSILRFGKYLLQFGSKFVSARFVLKDRGAQLLKDKKNLVFIRNFITGGFSNTPDDVLERHFFPGLYDYLEKKNYTPIFFSIITQTSNYRDLYQRVLKSKKPIIFPEEFLKLEDYLYTFLAPLRALRLRLSPPAYGQYQLERLLREEYYSNFTEFGFLYATLLSCLGKRFKEHHVLPMGIINWMENQALEKGLVKGLKENFPDIQVSGSQPFFSTANYFSTVCSYQEKHSGLLPEKILVLGPAGKQWASEFIKDAQIDYLPAFRYAWTISNHVMTDRENNLLVLMPIHFKDTLHIMRTLLKIEPQLKCFDQIMIKLHPIEHFDKKKLIKVLGQDFSKQYVFVDGKLEQYINHASIGLCGASSTAVELVMSGTPVVILGDTHALTMNYLFQKEDPDIWRLCFSCEQVIEALNHFRVLRKEKSKDLIQKAHEFRNFFMAPPSEKCWENYLVET